MLYLQVEWSELKRFEVTKEVWKWKSVPKTKCSQCQCHTIRHEDIKYAETETVYQFGDEQYEKESFESYHETDAINLTLWGLKVERVNGKRNIWLSVPVDMDGFEWKELEQAVRPLIDEKVTFKLVFEENYCY